MIRYGRYENSPDCFYLKFLDPNNNMRERDIHIHISEIRRFFGNRPNEPVIYNDSQLNEFFTYRAKIEGAKGDYPQKSARSRARITPTRRRGKPNSPGEGVE